VTEQQTAFWEAIYVFDKEGLLPYVMLIGSEIISIFLININQNREDNENGT